MKSTATDGARGDRAGILIASLCFVHCIAGPVLLTFAGFTSLINLPEKFESVFLFGSAAMGVMALVPAYRKKHGRVSCLAMFGCGLLCLLMRRHIVLHGMSVERFGVCTGALLLVGAHVLNVRFSQRCQCCEEATCSMGEEGRVNPKCG